MTRRRWFPWVVMPSVVVLAVPLTLGYMAGKDRQHARFYDAGQTINGFLKSYCHALEEAHETGDAAPVLAHYSPRYRVPDRGRWTWSEPRLVGNVVVSSRRAVGGDDYGRAEIAAEVLGNLAEVGAVERTTCKIDVIESLEIGRRARLTVKHILDGADRRGRPIQDRYFFRWDLAYETAADGTGAWRIERDELVEGVRVAAPRADRRGLETADPQLLGIDYEHRRDPKLDMKRHRSELRFGVAQHIAGGVSAADYDGDGRPDLLFLDGRRSRLYRHQGVAADGLPRFADVTAEAGLEGIGEAHSGLFADFDNDGDRDLFVTRYLASNRYYRNDGRDAGGRVTFTEASAAVGLDAALPSTSATALDYDRDGDLDLYVAVFGDAFAAVPRLPFFARNGGANRLYRNDGGRFVDVTAETGVGDVGWSLAVATADVDADGWPDLVVANDFGRKSLYHNDGRRADGRVTFTETAARAGILDFGAGMGLAVGDYDDDGLPDLYTSNAHSNQRWFGEDVTMRTYVNNVLRSRWALLDAREYLDFFRLVKAGWIDVFQRIGKGHTLFHNRGGTFEEIAGSGAERAGWGWSVAFFDLDNDADLDLYAANGWISNTPGTDL